ncbi:preprotein translocase subunit SecE [Thermodesulfobacteriota bacterium]
MGRLQRKKASRKTKKKKGVDTRPMLPANSEVAESSAVPSFGAVKDTTKRIVSPQKKPAPAVKPSPGRLEKNLLEKGLQFLREVKVELKKVTWPTRKQTIGSTVVVIILVMIISLFLGLVDVGLSSLVRVVLK